MIVRSQLVVPASTIDNLVVVPALYLDRPAVSPFGRRPSNFARNVD